MRSNSIRVLLVDDDVVDAELTTRLLKAVASPTFEVSHATTLRDAIEVLRDANYDVVLLDLGLPDSPRGDTLSRFREECSAELPVIVLTGLEDEQSALESLDQGAQDYLGKDSVTSDLLLRSIRYAMQRQQLHEQLASTNVMLEQNNKRLTQLYDLAQQFVENVSHEFRTPLTVIREFTSIVRDGLDGPVTPRQSEHLDKVLHRTDDLALMVDDMLDISKLEAGLLGVWRRPCYVKDLVEAVRGVVKGRADSKKISLRIDVDDSLPQVFCDEEKARRVMINLAVNAIKFTPEGGAVEIWAHGGTEGSEVRIGITDTGPGLSSENLAVIFKRFRQVDHGLCTSTKGFGLGLNIAKELVSLNLGQIDVESEVGAGSTFSFTLSKYEPRDLITRYFRHIDSTLGDETPISLMIASIDISGGREVLPVADEFLQRTVRANDLVVSYVPGAWVIAASCPITGCAPMIDRLMTQWNGFLRNSPKKGLPGLQIEHLHTGSLAANRSELESLYLELASKQVRRTNGQQHSSTVLVVDDDPEVSQCLGVRLEAAGFHVLMAADGQEGVDSALKHHPDAVVLDVRMPKKDGMEVLRELRRDPSTSQTPIVMLSASIRDQHKALEAGASYFVPKPYEAAEVLSALESSLHQEISA
jgi:signal transduction histidine kinase